MFCHGCGKIICEDSDKYCGTCCRINVIKSMGETKRLINTVYVDAKLLTKLCPDQIIFETSVGPYNVSINGVMYNPSTYSFANLDALKFHLRGSKIVIIWVAPKEHTPAERLLSKWDKILYNIENRYILRIFEHRSQ